MRNAIIFILLLLGAGVCLAGWERTYGGSDYDGGYSVAQTSDGGYIVAGRTWSFGASGADIYLIKTDSLGYTGIGESPTARPENIAISAYPNPFNSTVTIAVEQTFLSVQNGQTGMSDLPIVEIFDIAGQMVANLPVMDAHLRRKRL